MILRLYLHITQTQKWLKLWSSTCVCFSVYLQLGVNCVCDRAYNGRITVNELEKFYSNIYPTRRNGTQFILSGNCSTCFGCYHHPSSRAQTTVSTASGICQTVTATCRYIPDAVDTVVCALDDGWRYHPKHAQQFPDKINCVTLHLVGCTRILEYSYDARTHER
jgi:hypothetical protein